MQKTILLIFITLLFSCHKKTNAELIVGKWHSVKKDDETYSIVTFYKDKTGKVERYNKNLELDQSEEFTYTFTHDEGRITIAQKDKWERPYDIQTLTQDSLKMANSEKIFYRIDYK